MKFVEKKTRETGKRIKKTLQRAFQVPGSSHPLSVSLTKWNKDSKESLLVSDGSDP
jgi:hypothetical protein